MNGAMMNFRKYNETVKNMPAVIMPSENPKVKLDINGLINYAHSVGKKPVDLSDEEKARFVQGDYKAFYERNLRAVQ